MSPPLGNFVINFTNSGFALPMRSKYSFTALLGWKQVRTGIASWLLTSVECLRSPGKQQQPAVKIQIGH